MQRALGGRFYYGWVVVAVVFLALLVSAGVRAAPTVLINPLETELGGAGRRSPSPSRSGLLLYGFSGPVAGWLMDRFGPTRVTLVGLVLIGGSTLAGAAMTELWQLNLFWGVLSGVGTGIVAPVLGATVANRWFVERRGLVLGVFGAAASAGQLVSVPALMWLVVAVGWREGTVLLAAAVFAILAPVLLFMRDDPSRLGLRPYGAPGPEAEHGRRGEPRARAGDAGARPRAGGVAGAADAGVLAALGELLHLRGVLERHHRGSLRTALHRPRHPGGHGRRARWRSWAR